MQFSVPQFTDVEDRLIGSLTLKQFLVLLGAGAICLVFWTIFGPSIIFFLLSIPVAVLGVASAIGKYNGRPMFTYLVPFAAFMTADKVMVFKRESGVISVSKSEAKIVKKEEAVEVEDEPAESRLRKLAYMLDQKTEEQKDIISKDEMDIIRTASLPKVEFSKAFAKAKDDIIATAKKLPKVPTLPKIPPKRRGKASAPKHDLPVMPKRPARQQKPVAKKFDPSSFLQ